MAKLVQRRSIIREDPNAKGPGGTILPLIAPLTRAGWLAVLAGAVYAVSRLLPFVSGERELSSDTIQWLLIAELAAAVATLLLPAALQLGYPDVARRNRWLFRGAVLLAVGQAIVIASSLMSGWLFDQMTLADDADFAAATLRINVIFGSVGIVRSLVQAAGWLSIWRGLRAAGAPFRGEFLATLAAGAAVVQFIPYGLSLLNGLGEGDVEGLPLVVEVANLVVALTAIGLAFAVSLQLLAGARQGRLPRWAWRAAALYGVIGVLSLVVTVWLWVVRPAVSDGSTDPFWLSLRAWLSYGGDVVLLVAFALGLGRGTDVRHAERPRVARYWVTGGRRLREAGA